jgi:hypothetical protein
MELAKNTTKTLPGITNNSRDTKVSSKTPLPPASKPAAKKQPERKVATPDVVEKIGVLASQEIISTPDRSGVSFSDRCI